MNESKPDVTTNIYFDVRVTNKEGKHPAKLVVYHEGERKFYTLKGTHKYTKEEIKNIQDLKKKAKRWKDCRTQFEKEIEKARDIIDSQLEEFSFEEFEYHYKKKFRKESNTLKASFKRKIKDLEELERYNTASLYTTTLNSLIEFDENISFKKLSKSFLEKYNKQLIDKGCSPTTRSIYLRNLRCVINESKTRLKLRSPFEGEKPFKIPDSKTKNSTLSKKQTLTFISDNSKDPNEKDAINYWKFSYFSAGMNMSDIARLRYSDIRLSEEKGDKIKFIRYKTRNTKKVKEEIKISLLPEAKKVIEEMSESSFESKDYVFPILKEGMPELDRVKRIKQHTKTTNKYLSKVAERLKFNIIPTMYDARHSYSNNLKNSKASIVLIKESLGHSSLQVTENYLHSFEEGQAEEDLRKGLF